MSQNIAISDRATVSAQETQSRLRKCYATLAALSFRIILYSAGPMMLVILGACYQAAQASGGLVGAAVDPAFGQANEVGMVADYGYDMARDISRVFTAVSTIPAAMAGAKMAHSYSMEGNAIANQVRGILTALTVTFGFPTVIHLLGTFAINNFGGLGGGL